VPPARPRLLSIIGSRPEIIQAVPLCAALEPVVDEILVHTGQHYDTEMSEGQILDTELPRPAHNLDVGSRSHSEQLAVGQERIAAVLESERPDAVLVRGDTNATVSGARAAVAAGLPLMHVEAGLRSWREDLPEEHNRVEADGLSDLLFAPTETARANLEAEDLKGTVHLTGDLLCDMLLAHQRRLGPPAATEEYVLATVHRNYNTDDPERLAEVLACLGTAPCPVIFPVHPRTRARIAEWELGAPANLELVDPVPYTRMLELERGALAIATDSGGVQREAYLWGVLCLSLRDETEWVETVETGWSVLVGVDAERFAEALARPRPTVRPPVFGDGAAAPRMAALVAGFLDSG